MEDPVGTQEAGDAPPAPSPSAPPPGPSSSPSAAASDPQTQLHACSRQELLQLIGIVQERGGGALVQEALGAVLQRRAEAEARATDAGGGNKGKKKKKSGPREFDFGRFSTRHIALQLSYEGDRYLGFASQGNADEETVEGQLLLALMKTKLVQDRAWACYSRCGRTDKGVSALRQVVGLRVRSALKLPPVDEPTPVGSEAEAPSSAAEGDIWAAAFPTATEGELDYCGMLNRVLPPDIRVLGWAPTPAGFSARFCASHRTYRYFFDAAGLDLEAMRAAAAQLVGDHDFRNFCKMDATAVHSFRRVIHEARILEVGAWRWAVDTEGGPLPVDEDGASSSICCLQIQGQAFLWHMVRCIMAVLFLVGRRLEAPGIVTALLDIAQHPAKPHYAPAPDGPLVLHDCGFTRLGFHHASSPLFRLWSELRAARARAAVRLARVDNHMEYVAGLSVSVKDVEAWAEEELVRADRGRSTRNGAAGKKRKRQQQQQQKGQEGGADAMSVDEAPEEEHEQEAGEEAATGGGDKENGHGWSLGREAVAWREALRYLETRGLRPEPAADDRPGQGAAKGAGGSASSTRYIPLAERAVGRTYEETVAGMGGRKREAYEACQRKKEAAALSGGDAAFFRRLRGQEGEGEGEGEQGGAAEGGGAEAKREKEKVLVGK